MSLGEIIWVALIVVYTISFASDLANSTPEMLGILTGGVILGIVPIYVGRRLKQRKDTLEEIR